VATAKLIQSTNKSADYDGDRRRNQGLDGIRRKDERQLRRHAKSVTWHDEPDVTDGGTHWHRLANMAGVLCIHILLVCIRLALLRLYHT
jgi:hypothetical protein